MKIKKHYTLYNIRKATRLFSLVVLMTFGLSFDGWGQNNYYIIPQYDKKFPQENVPTLVDTIYVKGGDQRELVIPNTTDYYYIRWYRKDPNGGSTISKLNSNSSLRESSGGGGSAPSYFRVHNMNGNKENAFRINYQSDVTLDEDSVFCDLSFNVDGLGINPSSPYTEPTIGKRYKFYIKNADDMKKRLDNVKGSEALDTIYITVPYGATNVNLQMNMAPENYFWGDYQGSSFRTTDNARPMHDIDFSTKNRRLIQVNNEITTETTVEVRVVQGYNNVGPILARYILTPQENSGFQTEAQIENDEDRNPASHPDKYQQVGVVDFDYGGSIEHAELNNINNMGSVPVDPSKTTYSFMNPKLESIYHPEWMPEDAYGLYRSANVSGISETKSNGGNEWAKSYNTNFSETNKTYGWYYTKANVVEVVRNRELYDRTYYSSDEALCGYFYYVNASAEAGRVVTIPIEGTICPNTELTVVAWVADITDAATPPNVNLILRGENDKGESGVLHRFSSGDMLRPNGDYDRAIWKQLCYKITVNSEMLASYTDFSIEFQNNTPNTNGGDYAIDDIRIYKTLPNISVRRKDACDASTLYVSSDYETILRNMGWKADSDVLNIDELENVNYRKYRYGLMGNDPYANIENIAHTKIGNVYYSFAYPDPDLIGDKSEDWVTVRKDLMEEQALTQLGLHKTMRVFVPTDLNTAEGDENVLPTDIEDVPHLEIVMNVRAMNDFIADTKRGPSNDQNNYYWKANDLIEFGTFEEISFEEFRDEKFPSLCKITEKGAVDEVYWKKIRDNDEGLGDTYTLCIRALYEFLKIPRIHCPWKDEDGKNIFLGTIDVANTDLRYRNEQRPGETTPADGKYRVVLFSAREVAGGIGGAISLKDPCTLISDFTVEPATTITIRTEANTNTATCAGALRKVNAVLNGYDADGNPIEDLTKAGINYLFDWYLGSQEAYEADSLKNKMALKTDLETFRNATGKTGTITVSDLENWNGNDGNGDPVPGADRIKKRLTDLLTIPDEYGNILLKTGKAGTQDYDLLITGSEIIAMPYVYSVSGNANDYVYCSNKTPVNFEVADEDIPEMYTGFANVTYPFAGSVALRLGQLNLGETTSLSIPVRNIDKMVTGATSVGVQGDAEVSLHIDGDVVWPVVGTVSDFKINESTLNARIPIKWNKDAKNFMKEGQSYELLIPFVQFKGEEVLSTACDGLVSFTVKIVPEHLTWKGVKSDAWYNDENWQRSTKAELYMEDKAVDEDVNGDKDVENAFSPLYFSKITIDPKGSNVLTLENLVSSSETPISGLEGSKATSNIQYDMAVVDNAGKISSYYINKIDQIYFKPDAKLVNQHLLDYEKAWVEFEIKNGEKRWMTSPLQHVYAGDIYAPTGELKGRQETSAFSPIEYQAVGDITYNRWAPAFYQKAWDKEVEYFPADPSIGDDGAVEVGAVKSNWSIEYNDVRVPYTIGKGFYLSVEDVPESGIALVRLPKVDTEYTYESKSVLRSNENLNKTNSGKLVNLETKDNELGYYIDLSDEYGDGTHFLIGNPFMSNLDMSKFFKKNPNLTVGNVGKYWTLKDGTSNATMVGTPDGKFPAEDAQSDGIIEPMQAFFVELNENLDGTNKTVIFTPDMMTAEEPTAIVTKSTSAINPAITLTADRGDVKSIATLRTSDKADNAYKADEDAVVLLDSELDAPMVYTVAGSQAAQVNAVKSVKNIGLGVFNEGGDEVTVTIEGLSRMAETLYLYDAQTRKSVKLDSDSYSLTLSGDSHGRYYLRDSALGSELENTISIYSAQRGRVIVSALRPVKDIKVFGLNGSLARQFSVNTTQYGFDLPAGIYMIHASDGEREYTEKVIVR